MLRQIKRLVDKDSILLFYVAPERRFYDTEKLFQPTFWPYLAVSTSGITEGW